MRTLKFVLTFISLLGMTHATEMQIDQSSKKDIVDASWVTKAEHQFMVAKFLCHEAKNHKIDQLLQTEKGGFNTVLLKKARDIPFELTNTFTSEIIENDGFIEETSYKIDALNPYTLTPIKTFEFNKLPIMVKVTRSSEKANLIDVSSYNKIYGPRTAEKAIAQAKAQFFK